MKTRIATALSVVGVLGAGSAAALVNTQILDGAPAESSASAAALAPASSVDITIPGTTPDETTPSTQPETTEADTTTMAPTTTEPTVPAKNRRAQPAAPSGFLTTYNVGDAGVVTLDVVDGRLVLVNAAPKSGWSISSEDEDSSDDEIDVEFLSSTVRVEFSATFVDGQIVPKVTSKSVSRGTKASGGSAPAPAPAAAPAAPAPSPTAAPYTDDDHYESDDDDHYESDDDDHYESDDDEYESHDDDHEERDDD